MSEQSNAVMLPKDVRPVLYDLILTPDLDSFTFAGEETVAVEVLESTSSVTLNCAEIEVASCRVTAGGVELTPSDISFDEQAETVTFGFDQPLPVGPARLHVEFSGVLNDLLRGFYRSRYVDEDGAERHLATTQFEATDARRAFPCWDEPALKAQFRLSLVVPSDLAAVSNTLPVSESDLPGGLRRVTFGDTPVMSTYLLAFVVGDLRSIEQRAPCGTLVRVWGTPGKERQGQFALDLSVKLLDYFNGYFGVPYPLEKLDHIAIPDFAAGAMENWGAITYRENALLVDPELSSAVTRQNVAGIVAHEMAHMWFGDLVTMAWWNDLWLNEAFASWMGDKSVDFAFPEWDVWTQFVSFDTNAGLGLDGLRSSHPIEQPVDNPSEIGQLFDAISYSKGGAVLRMLEQFLGPEVFRQGIAHYISKHQYGNARTQDLWDALGEASGQPVRVMMNSWVLQTGYPVVEIETERGRHGAEVSASQRRFFYENIVGAAEDDTLWHVPLSVKTFVTGTTSLLMDGDSTTLDVALPAVSPRGDWIMVNPERTGFYRTNYSEEEWARLKRGVERLGLSAADRLGLQDDAYALAKAGYLPATQFLSLAEAYVGEPEAPVWLDLSANLGGMERLLADEEFFPLLPGAVQAHIRAGGGQGGVARQAGRGPPRRHVPQHGAERARRLRRRGDVGPRRRAVRPPAWRGRDRPQHPHRRDEPGRRARGTGHVRRAVEDARRGDDGGAAGPGARRSQPRRRAGAATRDPGPLADRRGARAQHGPGHQQRRVEPEGPRHRVGVREGQLGRAGPALRGGRLRPDGAGVGCGAVHHPGAAGRRARVLRRPPRPRRRQVGPAGPGASRAERRIPGPQPRGAGHLVRRIGAEASGP